MKNKREKDYELAQIEEMVKKKVKTFSKEYVDKLNDNETIIIPLIAFKGKQQINLGRVNLFRKNVKEIYYDKKLSVKSTIDSEIRDDAEIYVERPAEIDKSAIVLKKRSCDTHLN